MEATHSEIASFSLGPRAHQQGTRLKRSDDMSITKKACAKMELNSVPLAQGGLVTRKKKAVGVG